MSTPSPFFSVVVPIYNKRGALVPMLQSVLGQTFTAFEVILIDDGSTDDGLETIQDLIDDRCRVIRQSNGGVSKARNRGIQAAQGNYVALLDSDDFWYPDHLETAHAFFQQHPEIRWYCSSWVQSASIAAIRSLVRPIARFEIQNYFASGHLAAEHPVWTSAVVIDRTFMNNVPLFPENLCLNGEDLYAWYRIATMEPCFGWTSHMTAIYVHPEVPALSHISDLTVYVPQLLNDFPDAALPGNRCLHQHIELWLRDHLERGDAAGISRFLIQYRAAMSFSFWMAWRMLATCLANFGTAKTVRLLTFWGRLRRRFATSSI